MGIELQKQYYITCDVCKDFFETFAGDYKCAIRMFRENGWKIGKKCICDECSAKTSNNYQNKTVATKRLDACPSAQSKDVIGCNKSYYSDNPQDDSGVSSKLAKEDNGKSTFPVDLKSTAQKDKKITKTDICEGN